MGLSLCFNNLVSKCWSMLFLKLLSPKPVFVHTSFQNNKHFNDTDGIGYLLDGKLSKISKGDNSPIIFMNENRFSGAYMVRGRYEKKGSLISVDVKIFEDETKKGEFKVEGVNATTIADRIATKLISIVK